VSEDVKLKGGTKREKEEKGEGRRRKEEREKMRGESYSFTLLDITICFHQRSQQMVYSRHTRRMLKPMLSTLFYHLNLDAIFCAYN
jgi:hypothetical protein